MWSAPNKEKYFGNANSGYFHWIILLRAYMWASSFTKINTPPWVFFTFFKLYKWYRIAHRITYWFIQKIDCFHLLRFEVFVFSIQSFVTWCYMSGVCTTSFNKGKIELFERVGVGTRFFSCMIRTLCFFSSSFSWHKIFYPGDIPILMILQNQFAQYIFRKCY